MTDALYHDAVRVLRSWAGPRHEEFLGFLAANPGGARRDHPGAHLTASTLVVAADGQRVLLCLHGRIRRWVQLGGHCEPGDGTLAGAALREATEESGIAGLVLSAEPIALHVHPVTCAAGPSLHYDVQYAALAPAGAVEAVSAESSALGWFTADALPESPADGLAPLVPLALDWAAARR